MQLLNVLDGFAWISNIELASFNILVIDRLDLFL